ncbi:MAG TPA: helix-turn-helix transcriptional regulator [Gaiellales bacterium]|jgi:PadR family transcriptional regulator PadR|nr:helix-turn-helix transcriptional regulator [Gaiellales bacterium]
MSASDLRGQIDLLLLSVLVAGPAHGYRVIERLREQSEGAFDLTEGTVYPALHRLERSGLLVSHWSDEAPRRRRVYAVTQTGRGSLATRRRDWAAFAGAMQAVIAQ